MNPTHPDDGTGLSIEFREDRLLAVRVHVTASGVERLRDGGRIVFRANGDPSSPRVRVTGRPESTATPTAHISSRESRESSAYESVGDAVDAVDVVLSKFELAALAETGAGSFVNADGVECVVEAGAS